MTEVDGLVKLSSPGARRAAFWMVFRAIFLSSSADLLPIANWLTAVYSSAFYTGNKTVLTNSFHRPPSFKPKRQAILDMESLKPLGNMVLLFCQCYSINLCKNKLTFPWFESRIWATVPATAPPYNRNMWCLHKCINCSKIVKF